MSLITAKEFLLFAKGDESSEAFDADRLDLLIDMVSQQVEDYCGREFITPDSDVVEYWDGDGEHDYYVKHRRISSLTKIEYRSGTTWYELDNTIYPYTYTAESGRIWFTNGHKFWTGDTNNWRVTYSYGWTQANLPASLKRAVCQLVQRCVMKADGKEGTTSLGMGDATTSFDLAKMPEDIKATLDKFARCGLG